jgi:uncharacterized protein YkwD
MRKARKLAKRAASGYRSEATMKFHKFFLLALLAILPASVLAQNGINPNHLSLRTAASTTTAVGASESVSALAAIERDTFQLINVERGLVGLPALKWNEKIAKVARLHSQNMADYNFFSHKGADGLMVDGRADQLKMGEWRAIGENIAFMQGYPNPSEVAVEKWLLSASHRNNLMSPEWIDSGIGVATTTDGKVYFTQVFLIRK